MLDVSEYLVKVTEDVFKSMMKLDVDSGPLVELSETPAETEIIAFIGLSGSIAGMLGVYTSSDLAVKMASAMLGSKLSEMNDEVRDGFGEVANILAGNVASVLGDLGEKIQLSLPSVIMGKFLVTTVLNTLPPRRARKFNVDGNDLYVELAFKREE